MLFARFIFLFFCICAHLFSTESPPYLKTLVFQSTNEIAAEYDHFQKLIQKKLDLFSAYSSKNQFDRAFLQWNTLMSQFLVLKVLVERTAFLNANTPLQMEILSWEAKLDQILESNLKQNKKLLRTWIDLGLKAKLLSPHQRYLTKRVLSEYLNISDAYQSDIQSALQQLEQFEEQNFSIYSKAGKENPSLDTLLVFSGNLLFFPDRLTYFFGGIRPWKYRIDTLARKLIATNAHILCLQEIWDPEIMPILINKLKGHYSFFVYDPGNLFHTLNPQSISFNSGLFIASKIPLQNISFTQFYNHDIHKGINRGILAATIPKQKIAFVNTHFQQEDTGKDAGLRVTQFNQVAEALQETIALANASWGFITGDFNLKAFSEEYLQTGIPQYFTFPYLKGQTIVTSENATETDYFNDLVYTAPEKRKNVKPEQFILDYTLSPKNSPFAFQTQRVVFFHISKPNQALSDHNGLLSTWILKKNN